MGWKSTGSKELAALKGKPKCVFIFSHTSFWDLGIFFLLRMAYPDLGDDMYTLVTPWAFDRKWRANLLERFNCIKATKIETSGEGLVNKVERLLTPKHRFFLLLSPEGMLLASPWRSGYYHIAKKLKVPIRVVGLDYEQKQIRFERYRDLQNYSSKEEMEKILKMDMGDIVPLYTEKTFVPIRKHNPKKVSVVNYSWFVFNISIFLQIFNLYRCAISWLSLSMFFYVLPNVLFFSIFFRNPKFFLGIFAGSYFLLTILVNFSELPEYHSLNI
jgi:hypothetical protein